MQGGAVLRISDELMRLASGQPRVVSHFNVVAGATDRTRSDEQKQSTGDIDVVNYFFDPVCTVSGAFCPFSEFWPEKV
jgi:hypothetical protein